MAAVQDQIRFSSPVQRRCRPRPGELDHSCICRPAPRPGGTRCSRQRERHGLSAILVAWSLVALVDHSHGRTVRPGGPRPLLLRRGHNPRHLVRMLCLFVPCCRQVSLPFLACRALESCSSHPCPVCHPLRSCARIVGHSCSASLHLHRSRTTACPSTQTPTGAGTQAESTAGL